MSTLLQKLKTQATKFIAICVLLAAVNLPGYGQLKLHTTKRPSPALQKTKRSFLPVTHIASHRVKKSSFESGCSNSGPYYVNDSLGMGSDVYTTAPGSDANCGTADAPFATIQHAIGVASAGDIIYVDAGTYEEQLIISEAVTIDGAGEGNTTVLSPDNLTSYTDSYSTNYPIIYVESASHVVIENLTVDGAGKGNANHDFEGITYHNSDGMVYDCEVKNIEDNPADGVQDGLAINAFADDSNTRTFIVRKNSVHDFQKNGITVDGAGLNTTIDSNLIQGAGPVDYIAQNGVQVSDGATGTITNNGLGNISYTPAKYVASGILVYASNSVDVTYNVVNDVQAGIEYYQSSGTISKNTLTNNASNLGSTPYWYAIDAEDGTTTVSQNEIYNGGNGSGIEADAFSGDVTSMTALNNKIDNSDEGIVRYDDTTGGSENGLDTLTAHYNSITNNASNAIHNYGIDTMNATCNWYGSIDSTTIAAKIAGPVNYIPYLFSGTDNNPNQVGFQPTNSCSQPFSVTLVSKTDVLCYNSSTGAINIAVNGGSGSYTYVWTSSKLNKNKKTQDIDELKAGTYKVVVTDKKYGEQDSLTVTINQPDSPLTLSVVSKNNLKCNGDQSGSIDVNATGGTPFSGSPNYQYSLNNGAYSGKHKFDNLSAGQYTITALDANGCTKSVSVTLTQPRTLEVDSVYAKNIKCHGNSTGIIRVFVKGGTSPFTYSLTGPVSQTSRTGTFKNLPAGNYNVTVTDANGCTTSVQQRLTEPAQGCSNSFEFTDAKIPGNSVSSLEATLMPNPSPTEFNLVVKSNEKDAVQIKVVDRLGVNVYSTQGSANHTYRFGEDFASGIYIVQIFQGATVKTLKAVKGQ